MAKRYRHGYYFEGEISDSLRWLQKEIDFWFMKLVDTHSFDGVIKKAEEMGGDISFLAPRVPSDFLIVRNGKALFIECKSSKKKNSFNFFDAIKDHQIEQGLEITANGGKYYFLINQRLRRKMKVYVFTAVDVSDIRAELEKIPYRKGHKKSLKWHEVEDRCQMVLEKNLMLKWDIRELITPL